MKITIKRISPLTVYGASYGAYDENGNELATHFCSNDTFARGDLGFYPPEQCGEYSCYFAKQRREIYADKFPEGFEVVWSDE